MGRRFVQQLTDGESIEEMYLVTDKQLRANRNGNTYLQVELRDRSGAISARLWNVGEAQTRSFDIGDYLLVKGKVQLFQGALQVILTGFERNESQKIELTDFLPHTEHDINKLLDRLKGFLRKMGNVHLKWAFSEAAVLFVRHCAEGKKLLARLENDNMCEWLRVSCGQVPGSLVRAEGGVVAWTATCWRWESSCTTLARPAN